MPNSPSVALLGVPFRRAGRRFSSAVPRRVRPRISRGARRRRRRTCGSEIDRRRQPGFHRPSVIVSIPDGGDERVAIEARCGETRFVPRAGLIALGGDHSVTYPLVAADHNPRPRRLFDPALRRASRSVPGEYEGDRYSHALSVRPNSRRRFFDPAARPGGYSHDERRGSAIKRNDTTSRSSTCRRGRGVCGPVVTGPVYISIGPWTASIRAFRTQVSSHREAGRA